VHIKDITPQEEKLINFLRQVGWGEVVLRVSEGKPVLICEAIRTHRLEKAKQEKQKKKNYAKREKTRVWRAQ